MIIKHVIIAIAMEAEAMPFVGHLNLQLDDSIFHSRLPFQAFSGQHTTTGSSGDACKVTVITSGKDAIYGTGVDNCGTVPAALATYLALDKIVSRDNNNSEAGRSQYLLINAGTCGGFARKGAQIGDVYLTTAVANHDRRIPIPAFTPYGIGRLDSGNSDTCNNTNADNKKEDQDAECINETNPTLVSGVILQPPTHLAATHGYKLGVCTTGNSLDKTPEDDHHMNNNDASVKDMEAAAVAWACALYQDENTSVPYLGVKVVTDIVDGDVPTQVEFLENLHTASVSLQEALPKILDHVCGKELSEL